MLLEKMKYLWHYFAYVMCIIWYVKILKKRRPVPRVYASKKVLSAQEGNDYIRDGILSKKPFMAGRFGSAELSAFVGLLAVKLGLRKELKKTKLEPLCKNAGFFPDTQEAVMRFCDLMAGLTSQVDLLAVWSLIMEDYIISTYAPQTRICRFYSMEPYYHKDPWSRALENKKVLVIHPFEKTILHQYEKRKSLFDNKNVLPEFELKTIKAVQTIAGEKSEFSDWFEALDYMYDKAAAIDFDVAIIGCGAYGFPLAAKIKKMGRQAVHMAGATQLLFGIKGARWDTDPFVSKLYNDHWVRPDRSETPPNAGLVEGGCYW